MHLSVFGFWTLFSLTLKLFWEQSGTWFNISIVTLPHHHQIHSIKEEAYFCRYPLHNSMTTAHNKATGVIWCLHFKMLNDSQEI